MPDFLGAKERDQGVKFRGFGFPRLRLIGLWGESGLVLRIRAMFRRCFRFMKLLDELSL